MDEDKTGTVSRDELKQVLMDMNLAITPDVVGALIDIADVDGDGDISSHLPPTCLPRAMLRFAAPYPVPLTLLRPLTLLDPLTLLHPHCQATSTTRSSQPS
jgi:hypothetical protein